MAKKKEKHQDSVQIVEETLTRTEQFIENNQKILTYVVIGIVIIVLGFILVKKYYIGAKETEAQNQIWAAQSYFEADSLYLAMNGDGNYLGFNDIINDYSWTKSKKLAYLYNGLIYLRQGDFDLAIENLKKFKTSSRIMSAMALGATGDAYAELNDMAAAAKYYREAAEDNPNDFISPLFLMKAAWAYEVLNDYESALEMYQIIKDEHQLSNESREVDKYIARAKTMMPS